MTEELLAQLLANQFVVVGYRPGNTLRCPLPEANHAFTVFQEPWVVAPLCPALDLGKYLAYIVDSGVAPSVCRIAASSVRSVISR